MSTEEIVIMIQKGNAEVKNELWDRIWKLVFQLCKPYRDYAGEKHIEMDDLLNTAWLGVERAIMAYDPKKEYVFLTYLRYHVKNAVRELLGLRGKKQPDTVSLDETIDEDEELTRLDTIEDDSAAEQFRNAEDKQFADWLWSRTEKLPNPEQDVILAYYRDKMPLTEYARRSGSRPQKAAEIKNHGLQLLARDKEIRALYDEYAWTYTNLATFKSTWTSSTELAVLRIESEREKLCQTLPGDVDKC